MKVVIIGGAGGVGSSAACSLLNSPHGYEIVLVDTRPEMITSHVMDLENVAALGAATSTVRALPPRSDPDTGSCSARNRWISAHVTKGVHVGQVR